MSVFVWNTNVVAIFGLLNFHFQPDDSYFTNTITYYKNECICVEYSTNNVVAIIEIISSTFFFEMNFLRIEERK
jgi:hypothetical protein